MKIFKMMLCAVALVALTACGGGYDKNKSEELYQKIQDAKEKGEVAEFTDDEHAVMIDQWLAAGKAINERKLDAIDKDEAKEKENRKKLKEDKDYQTMIDHYKAFNSYLWEANEGSNDKAKLSEDNKKKYKEAQEELNKHSQECEKKAQDKVK